MVRYFAEHVAAVARPRACRRRSRSRPSRSRSGQAGGGRPLRSPPRRVRERGIPVALLQRHLLRGVRQEVGKRDAGMGVTRVEEHVRDGNAQGLRDPQAHLLRRSPAADRQVDADDREVDADDDDLGGPVLEHQRRRREIALDRLNRVAEQPESRLPRAERRVDKRRATPATSVRVTRAASVRRGGQVDHRPRDEPADPARGEKREARDLSGRRRMPAERVHRLHALGEGRPAARSASPTRSRAERARRRGSRAGRTPARRPS